MVEKEIEIDGLKVITPSLFADNRGYFMEFYNQERYNNIIGTEFKFVQDNISISKKNVVRGLHFQSPPFEQGKLVQVLNGRATDVVVDIRKNSPTYGKYFKIELSNTNNKQLWIPPGFAHGFVALEDQTIFSYKCTNFYSKENEMALRWDDELLGIDWGIIEAIVSKKDQESQSFKNFYSPF